MAFLSTRGRRHRGTSKCFSDVASVVRLGPHGDVNISIITLQERSFQEKHTSAKLYL